jgi:hypothetical protein
MINNSHVSLYLAFNFKIRYKSLNIFWYNIQNLKGKGKRILISFLFTNEYKDSYAKNQTVLFQAYIINR